MNAEIIKFVVLGVVLIAALMRLKATIQGRNRSIFVALVLMLVGVALSIESIYLAVDGALGGLNYANLLIRFVMFTIFVILGVKMAKAFESPWAARLIVGPVGLVVLAICSVLAVLFFIQSDLPQSSVGLHDYGSQETVRWYGRMGRIYPTFVAACLIVPAARCALSRSASVATRVASSLLTVGFTIMLGHEIGRELRLVHGILDVILPFSTVLLVTVGLIMFVVARVMGEKAERPKALSDRC